MATKEQQSSTLTYKEQLNTLVEQRRSLGSKIGDGSASAEDFDAARSIGEQIKSLTEEREKSLSGLKNQVRSLGLEPADLFEQTQIKQAYAELFPSTATGKSSSSRSGVKAGKRPRKEVDAATLVISKPGKGGGVKITRDDFLASKFGTYTKVFFKTVAERSKDAKAFAEELLKEEAFANDGAALAAGEGKTALEALYNHSKTANLPPKGGQR